MSLIKEVTETSFKFAGGQPDRQAYVPPTEAERMYELDVTLSGLRGGVPSDRELTPSVDPVPAEIIAAGDAARALGEEIAADIDTTTTALANARRWDNALEAVKLTQRLAVMRAQLYEAKKAEIDADMAMLDHLLTQWRVALQNAKQDQETARSVAKAAQVAELAAQRRVEIVGNHLTNNRTAHANFAKQREELRQLYQSISEV